MYVERPGRSTARKPLRRAWGSARGNRTSPIIGTLFDGITRHTEEAYRWAESFAEKGFREVIRERDAPWRDYGERPRD